MPICSIVKPSTPRPRSRAVHRSSELKKGMAMAKKRRRKAGEWSSSDVHVAGSRSSLFAMFYSSLFDCRWVSAKKSRADGVLTAPSLSRLARIRH